jgi:hypothetical protein
LRAHGTQANINSGVSWYDIAPTSSFTVTPNGELADPGLCGTHDEAGPDLLFHNEAFWGRRRRHRSLVYPSPASYEQIHYERV